MLHHPKNIFDQNSAVIAHFPTKKKKKLRTAVPEQKNASASHER